MQTPFLREKPIPPKKPSTKLESNTSLMEVGTRYFYYYNRNLTIEEWEEYNASQAEGAEIKIKDILKKFPDKKEQDNLYITIEFDEDHAMIVLKSREKVENKNYEEDLKKYNCELKYYEEDLKRWEEEKEIYKEKMLKYKTDEFRFIKEKLEKL